MRNISDPNIITVVRAVMTWMSGVALVSNDKCQIISQRTTCYQVA